MNILESEDLSTETNNNVYFNARQIRENVKLDELVVIEIDQTLVNLKRVFFIFSHRNLFVLTSYIFVLLMYAINRQKNEIKRHLRDLPHQINRNLKFSNKIYYYYFC